MIRATIVKLKLLITPIRALVTLLTKSHDAPSTQGPELGWSLDICLPHITYAQWWQVLDTVYSTATFGCAGTPPRCI